MTKFAKITGELLVRKGDAAPSLTLQSKRPHSFGSGARMTKAPVFGAQQPGLSPMGHDGRTTVRQLPHSVQNESQFSGNVTPMPSQARHRRIMVEATDEEIEQLDIAAIKKGCTRHQVVQEAIEMYMTKLAKDLCKPCSCLMGYRNNSGDTGDVKSDAHQSKTVNARDPASRAQSDNYGDCA